jgi:hypothetical protein
MVWATSRRIGDTEMQAAAALTRPDALLRLIGRLEPQARQLPGPATGEVAGGVLVPSPLDPGASVAFVVAAGLPPARADGEKRWWQANIGAVEEALAGERPVDMTVIFPGDWPSRIWRTPDQRRHIRLVSAIHYLWAKKLACHDDRGDVDDARRREMVARLAGKITPEEELRYTKPSLYPIDGLGSDAGPALNGLLSDRPDLPSGLTVLFGPGGIGKTFFLRRLTARLGRQAIQEPAMGIPVYAALPLLLHTDALGTWLSDQGMDLPLNAINVLIEEGVIVPVLDALDELVRGQAREGSRHFLDRLRNSAGDRARAMLSSRDYFLNLDPLVPTTLGEAPAYLTVGYFDRGGRRRYVEMFTGLSPTHAARWANQLEGEAAEALSGAEAQEVESLIGHPLFLDAFCQMIVSLPENRRAAEATNFRLRSPNIFGEIVERILQREHEEKFLPGWQSQGWSDRLAGIWKDPFTPAIQRRLLRRMVLQVAEDGGAETLRRGEEDPRYLDLRHGLFTFTGRSANARAEWRTVLEKNIRDELGEPQFEPGTPDSEAESIRTAALAELVGAFRSHTLADTQPNPPNTLVFATRHRAYFDYLLAEAVLEELLRALGGGPAGLNENFVLWCLEHNIFERGDEQAPPFASCLDFVLWHREAVAEAVDVVDRYLSLSEVPAINDELASYICSLGLALLLSDRRRRGGAELVGLQVAPGSDGVLGLISDIIPSISELSVSQCSLPTLTLRDIDLQNVNVTETELGRLEIGGATWRHVTLAASVSVLAFTGEVYLDGCELRLEGPLEVECAAPRQLTLTKCRLSRQLYDELAAASGASGGTIQLVDCEPLDEDEIMTFSPGRRFVNKLCSMARKHGHANTGVFRNKLKGRSTATSASFAPALAVLARRGVIADPGSNVITLTEQGEASRFSGKSVPGMREYADVADFWDPIIAELNEIMERAR